MLKRRITILVIFLLFKNIFFLDLKLLHILLFCFFVQNNILKHLDSFGASTYLWFILYHYE
jgi:hypothetical protein